MKTESGIPLITAKNVRMGYISEEPREFIDIDNYDAWMTRGIPKNGDILITTEAPLGNVAQLKINGKIALAQRIITIQPFAPIDQKYVCYLLMSSSIQIELKENATGTTVEGIKSSKLKKISIPLPPLPEQKRIVKRLELLLGKIEKVKNIKVLDNELILLRQSILSKAFRGELGTNDPQEESALELLKEILQKEATTI